MRLATLQVIVYTEFVPPGQTVNQVLYKDVIERLRKRVIRLRPDIADNWMLNHESAPCHTALSVTEFFTSKGFHIFPQPPYPSALSPCDFFLFTKLKNVLKVCHFGILENIQKSATGVLMTILIEDFQCCYQKWEQRLHGRIAAQGNYFERDNIDVWIK